MRLAVRVACTLAAVSVISGESLSYSSVGWDRFPTDLGAGTVVVALFGLASAFLVALPATLVLVSMGKANPSRLSIVLVAVWAGGGPPLAYVCVIRPMSTTPFPILM